MATFEDQIKQKVLELASAGATEKEIDAFVSDAMSGRSALKAEQPETVSTITGMTPAQAQARAEAGMQALEAGTREFAEAVPPAVARYGVPVAAGMATAPLSFPAAAATMTGTLGLMSFQLKQYTHHQHLQEQNHRKLSIHLHLSS